MKAHLRRIATAFLVVPLSMAAAAPATKSDVRLWRLDCGLLWTYNLDELSDTRAYVGQSKKFVGSCYLIRHGDAYLLWDTGLSKEYLNKPYAEGDADSTSLATTVVGQLAKIGVAAAQL